MPDHLSSTVQKAFGGSVPKNAHVLADLLEILFFLRLLKLIKTYESRPLNTLQGRRR
jgi:hypothetical protein